MRRNMAEEEIKTENGAKPEANPEPAEAGTHCCA